MRCVCGKPARVRLSYAERGYCKRCFLRYLEKRVRKDLRLSGKVKPNDKVFLKREGCKEWWLARYFLKSIFKENIRILNSEARGCKVLTPMCLEEYVSEKLREFLENTDKEFPTLILENVLEEEVAEACNLLGFNACKEAECNVLVEEMEKLYPGTKFALYHSFKALEELRKKS